MVPQHFILHVCFSQCFSNLRPDWLAGNKKSAISEHFWKFLCNEKKKNLLHIGLRDTLQNQNFSENE